MAWYRCGGGAGLPASLKTGMNNVLNKKFGTVSQDYPPNGWPDDVNLMGLLEEKTQASASICAFSDGADEVPLKKCEITLPASLDGYSAVDVVQMGKNLLDNQLSDGSAGGITYSLNSDGSISCVGTVTNTNSTRVISTNVKLPVGNYVLSGADTSISLRCTIYDKDGTYTARNDTGNGVTVSVTSTTDYLEFRVRARNADEVVNTTIYPQFEAGSTPTTYEKYNGTIYTASLGRTIYGGTVDVVKGEGTDDRLRYDLDENDTWGVYSGTDHSFWHNVATGEDRPIDVTKLMESICNQLNVSSLPIASAPDFTFGIQGGQRIVVTADSSINTLDKFKTWLETHPLEFIVASATPTDFTFSPVEINSRLGDNTMWSDGDMEVTYRGQGTLTPVLPTLISKSITENGTYNASDDSADGYSSVAVNVSGCSCERLLYLHCVNNDQIEIPAASSITQGAKYSQYVSYDSTTKKFTVLQDFTAIIIAWVYTYQTYESSRSDGALYINNSQVIQYEANGTAAGSTGGVYLARNFKQNDTFNVYTPTRDGYPQQNLKIYLLADIPDNIYTFTDENA